MIVTALPRKRVFLWTALLPLFLLAVGSFADYPVSLALYQGGNLPGRILAGFGVYPVMLALAAAGAMLLAACGDRPQAARVCQRTAGGMLLFAALLLSAAIPPHYCDIPLWAAAAVGAVCVGAAAGGTFWLCRGADEATVRRVAAAFLLVLIADLLIVNCIKIPWGRPRMRLVVSNPQAVFTPWWRPGTALRDMLTAEGIAAEEFKSFPSGHTANASLLMLLTLLPLVRPSLAQRQTALFLTGVGWTLLVALSRIVMGAHYMTDTAVGFAIGLLSLYGVCRVLFPFPRGRRPLDPRGLSDSPRAAA